MEHLDENFLQSDSLKNISKKYWPKDNDDESTIFSTSASVVTNEMVQEKMLNGAKVEEGAEEMEITVKRLNFKLNDFKILIQELVTCTSKD